MATDLERIEGRIVALRRELDDLETARRVIRSLAAAEGGNSPPKCPQVGIGQRNREKPARMTILETAKSILTERGEAYFKDVAAEAIARGYEGKKSSTKDKIAKSFWAIMKRNSDTFVATGKGKFRLKTQ